MIDKIDVKGGKLTYGQRIELGKILTMDNLDELELLQKSIKCLHEFDLIVTKDNSMFYAKYFEEIMEGILHWIDKEQLLAYEPTVEEKKAGIKKLSEAIGEYGTITALAERYCLDPDIILTWQYGKVFGLLYTDFEKHKFHKKYDEVMEKKYKQSK